MDSNDELYTIKPDTELASHLQQTEETVMIIVALLDALQRDNEQYYSMTTYYLKAIENLVTQVFDIYDCLYKINAQEAQFYRREHPIFSLNTSLTKERLHDYLSGTLYQLSALTESAVDDGMLTKLSTTGGNILISLSLQVKQLTQLVERLPNLNQPQPCG
jgi:hypothetical protein